MMIFIIFGLLLSTLLVSAPFPDYSASKYLLMASTSNNSIHVENFKYTVAQHLDQNVTLVYYGFGAEGIVKELREKHEKNLDLIADQSRFRAIDIGWGPFWARDALPHVIYENDQEGISLVQAEYYQGKVNAQSIFDTFGMKHIKFPHVFEWGNLIANESGDCLIVETYKTAIIPDSAFLEDLKCKRLKRFPYRSGIGHIDERVRFLQDKLVLTDTKDYVEILNALGYQVYLAPQLGGYKTYMNTLIINQTAFVPNYNGETDNNKAANELYRNFGFQVVPFNSDDISDVGHGSVHCFTMNYPEMTWKKFLSFLGAEEILIHQKQEKTEAFSKPAF